jgi:protoporphyrinogen oxidase
MKIAVIIGGGPAGLSAGYYLSKRNIPSVILEKDAIFGGLSRTVKYKGFRFDIGPHRFFTKSPVVMRLWDDVLGEDFLKVQRLTRIYYKSRLYNYPLRPLNAIFGLGFKTSFRIFMSLLKTKIAPIKPETNFESWVSNRFGMELYLIFFKTYTEKVWGIPCTEISADWAEQRIKSLSLMKALMQALGLGRKGEISSLVEEFHYPRLGAGQMYQALGEKVIRQGGKIIKGCEVESVLRKGDKITGVEVSGDGEKNIYTADAFFSSMPLTELVQKINPLPPDDVVQAAGTLRYRSLVTVNFILKKKKILPDNWIYIHSPEVTAVRMQIYNNWGPAMVPNPDMCSVGLEYLCFEDDDLWHLSDGERLKIGKQDLRKLGFASDNDIVDGKVIKYSKAYPVYDAGYHEKLKTIREFLDRFENLFVIGRYGQFRYNNMDHSIMTSYLAVKKMMGDNVDPWSVNADAEYLEGKQWSRAVHKESTN